MSAELNKDQNKEIWKAIKGYENYYEVSTLGNVRSFKYCKVRLLKPSKGTGGYYTVVLYNNNRGKTIAIHRLVAIAFLRPSCDDKDQVDHINNKRVDNRVENLRWVTKRENNQNRLSNKLSGNTSSFLGVYYKKSIGKFLAQINVEKKSVYLGIYNNGEDAAKAYDFKLIQMGLKPVNFPEYDYTSYKQTIKKHSNKYKGVIRITGKENLFRLRFLYNDKQLYFGTTEDELLGAYRIDYERVKRGLQPWNFEGPIPGDIMLKLGYVTPTVKNNISYNFTNYNFTGATTLSGYTRSL